jgi:hypothetical protein
MFNCLQEMMVIAPIDAEENKTQNITQEHRRKRQKDAYIGALRYSQFEHHNSDNDGDNPIAECFHAPFGHCVLSLK